MKHTIALCLLILSLIGCKQNQPQTEDKQEVEKPIISEFKACTKDAKLCPDGNAVSRDPNNNCEFSPCTVQKVKNDIINCTDDVKQCSDGSYVGRDAKNNCNFKPCTNTASLE